MAKMLAICIAIFLLLLCSDILPYKVHAESSGRSGDSRGSRGSTDSGDDDKNYCRQALPYQKAVEDKIKNLNGKKQPFPACTCGTSGTISKIDILDASCGKTTSLVTCSGCTGPQVPIASPTECNNVLDCFRGDLDKFCKIVRPRCKSFTVYRCGCPTVSTTQARSAAPITTTSSTTTPRSVTSTPLPSTTSVPPPPATTQSPPAAITISPTPILRDDYYDYG